MTRRSKHAKQNIIVKEIAVNRAVLESNGEQHQTDLEAIGFVRDGGRLIRPVADDADRKYLVITLINMNALFYWRQLPQLTSS